jgi:hypothetical protein
MSKYRKFIVAATGAVVIIGDVFFANGVLFSEGIETSVIALLTAISVYGVSNTPT